MRGLMVFSLATIAVLLVAGSVICEVPRLINYQGLLTDPEGMPTSGSHDLTFRIYGCEELDAPVLWEESHTAVEVTEGVFSLVLGSLAVMPDDLFASGGLWLGISVDGAPEMAPRTRITPVPWALRAGVADVALKVEEQAYGEDHPRLADLSTPGVINDPDNPVDWTQLKGVPSWLLDKGVLLSEMLSVDRTPRTLEEDCHPFGDNHSLDAVDCTPEDVVYVNADGNVGVNTKTAEATVEVVNGSMNARFCDRHDIDPGPEYYYGVRGASGEGASGYLGAEGLPGFKGGRYGVIGIAEGAPVINVGVYGKASGASGENLAGLFDGEVLVESGDLTVRSLGANGAELNLTYPYGGNRSQAHGSINFRDITATKRGSIEYHSRGMFEDGMHFRTGDNNTRMVIANSGYVGIGEDEPDAKLVVSGEGGSWSDGFVFIKNWDNDAGIRIYRGDNVTHHIFNDTHNVNSLRIAPDGAYASGGVTVRHNGFVGIGHVNPSCQLHVGGEGSVKCSILRITGGADIAEPFDVKRAEVIEVGMVLTIDAANPGHLKLSDRAYDRCVAGVVSGAGSIQPGMIMGQTGSTADGEFPVALTGRVYCWADASSGAIEPGDLLTTSDIPGHAMKATDRERSHGAVIGKAMTTLEEGQGLVLVLVNLQ